MATTGKRIDVNLLSGDVYLVIPLTPDVLADHPECAQPDLCVRWALTAAEARSLAYGLLDGAYQVDPEIEQLQQQLGAPSVVGRGTIANV